MSRMLEALRRIEAKQPRPQPPTKLAELHPAIQEELEELRPSILPFKEADSSQTIEDSRISGPIAVEATFARAESAVVSALSPEEPDIHVEMAQYILAKSASGQSAALLFTSPGECGEKTETLRMLSKTLSDHFQKETFVLDALPKEGARRCEKMHYVSKDWGCLFEEYKMRHQLVLVDAPSLACAQTAAMVSPCDGVYLVIRLGYTTAYEVRESVRVIEQAGGRLLGCIAVNAEQIAPLVG